MLVTIEDSNVKVKKKKKKHHLLHVLYLSLAGSQSLVYIKKLHQNLMCCFITKIILSY